MVHVYCAFSLLKMYCARELAVHCHKIDDDDDDNNNNNKNNNKLILIIIISIIKYL